ncbi:MAG: hypothetical protein PHC98_03070 [Syntrophotalea acetylenica]|nr:hypothetical protein [Syntrophotalea acetylenica]
MDNGYEKQKEAHGGWATIVWIASGIYFFATSPTATFISWQALVYFVVGMFIAAAVFGGLSYGIQRGLAKILMVFIKTPSNGAAAFIRVLGIGLFVVDTVVVFLSAQWAIQAMF